VITIDARNVHQAMAKLGQIAQRVGSEPLCPVCVICRRPWERMEAWPELDSNPFELILASEQLAIDRLSSSFCEGPHILPDDSVIHIRRRGEYVDLVVCLEDIAFNHSMVLEVVASELKCAVGILYYIFTSPRNLQVVTGDETCFYSAGAVRPLLPVDQAINFSAKQVETMTDQGLQWLDTVATARSLLQDDDLTGALDIVQDLPKGSDWRLVCELWLRRRLHGPEETRPAESSA